MTDLRTLTDDRLDVDLFQNAQLVEMIISTVSAALREAVERYQQAADLRDPQQPQMIGIGLETLPELDAAYDEVSVVRERLLAIADLYTLYQFEALGVFHVIHRLQDLLRTGALQPSLGTLMLYSFDLRETLHYTRHDRWAAYAHTFGGGKLKQIEHTNDDFQRLFRRFIRLAAQHQERGNIIDVRRAAIELRLNLAQAASEGHVNVLRLEVMQLLDDALTLLETADVRQIFDARTAADVIDAVMADEGVRRREAAQRQSLASAGSTILRWLAYNDVLHTPRDEFSTRLLEIVPQAAEWVAQAEKFRGASHAVYS